MLVFVVSKLTVVTLFSCYSSEVPKIEMLFLKGKEVEGEVLTAVEVIPKSVIQQHIWDKYKKEIKYQW